MQIRDARSDDIKAIVALWHEMMTLHVQYNHIFKMKDNAEGLYESYIQSLISEDSKKVLVAEDSAQVLGYIFCEIVELPPIYLENRLGCIQEISVAESQRRNGIGRKLVEQGSQWLKEQGISRIDIVIAKDNPISQGFWKKVGFQPYNESCYRRI